VNAQTRYIAIGILGVASVIIGSLLFALAIDDGDGVWPIFVAMIGVGLLLSGVGEVIVAAATYLRKSG